MIMLQHLTSIHILFVAEELQADHFRLKITFHQKQNCASLLLVWVPVFPWFNYCVPKELVCIFTDEESVKVWATL